ncbi:hypothetical protein AMTRI_Chr03g45830 [Amborella trichopoda]
MKEKEQCGICLDLLSRHSKKKYVAASLQLHCRTSFLGGHVGCIPHGTPNQQNKLQSANLFEGVEHLHLQNKSYMDLCYSSGFSHLDRETSMRNLKSTLSEHEAWLCCMVQ